MLDKAETGEGGKLVERISFVKKSRHEQKLRRRTQ